MVLQFLWIIFYALSSVIAFSDWDCVVGEWESWGKCTSNCDIGVESRIRSVLKNASNIFGQACPELQNERTCGEKNNGCMEFCEQETGVCKCFSGHMLSVDGKNCIDVNECKPNQNKGPCSHMCKNFDGGYECLCPKDFYLQKDGHSCSNIKSTETCMDGKHVYSQNKECVCRNNFTGLYCDRDESRCLKLGLCNIGELCSSYVKSNLLCVPRVKQVSVFLSVPLKIENFNSKVEEYFAYVYNNHLSSSKTFVTWLKSSDRTLRSKRTMGSIYPISLAILNTKQNMTLVTFGVINLENNYFIDAHDICTNLQTKTLNCFSKQDCKLMKQMSLECPIVYPVEAAITQTKMKKKSTAWYYAIIAVVLLPGLFALYFIHKYKRRKSRYVSTRMSTIESGDIEEINILYGQDETGASSLGDVATPLYESIDNLKSCLDNGDSCAATVPINAHYETPVNKTEQNKGELVVDLDTEIEERYVSPPSLRL